MSTEKQTQMATLDAVIVMGVVFSLLVGGFALFFSLHGSYSPAYEPEHRFKTDNATAATANAVEHVAEHFEPPSSAPQWFAVAILLLILRQLRLPVRVAENLDNDHKI